MVLDNKLIILAALVGYFQSPTAIGQSPYDSPNSSSDLETVTVQAKAEDLFQHGDFKRAHFIYLNELAPIGDKYAQYMIGYMHFYGLGMDQDPVLASAWYRLAAERGAPEFVHVRDNLISKFGDSDLARSDANYVELRQKYSDIVLRMKLVRRDFEMLDDITTGTRIGRTTSPVQVYQLGKNRSLSREAYDEEVQRRMQKELDLITAAMGIDPVDADLSSREIAELEKLVNAFVAQIDDR